FAFFTEAIFLGIYLYGWDRIPPRAHLAAGVIVALSGAASGVFVVIANAWMNAPTGFELVQGQAVNVDPLAAMANPAALPPALHLAFQLMVALGTYLALVALWTGWRAWRGADLAHERWLLRAIALAAPMGFLAVEAGWMMTELGRQPWVIYGVLKTADAVTPMPGLIVPFLTFTLLYCFLGVIVVWLLYRHILRSPAIMEWRGFYMPVK